MRNAGDPPKSRKVRRITTDFGLEIIIRLCKRCRSWKDWETEYYQGHSYGVCKDCKKAYYKEWKARHPGADAERKRKWYAEIKKDPDIYAYYYDKRKRPYSERDPEKRREYARRYYHRLKSDPKRYEEYLERRRIYARLRREQEGASLHEMRTTKTKYKVKYPETKLPVEPIGLWVDHQLGNGYCGNAAELAKSCGVSERMITKIKNREESVVRLVTVDTMLTNEGSTPLHEVYPEAS